MATVQIPVKTAPNAAACSQKHVNVVPDKDTMQFNLDKQQYNYVCHECQTPFNVISASKAK